MKSFIAITLGLSIISGLASCNKNNSRSQLSLAVSIPPQAALLSELTGDSIKIVTAVRSDANPESWEPSVADFASLNNASIYFSTGRFPFEKSIEKSLQSNIKFVDTSDGMELLYGTHGNCAHHHEDNHQHNDEADPHVWTSISNMRIMAGTMTDELKRIDPQYSAKYDNNLRILNIKLDSIENYVKQKLNNSQNKSFIIWHPSLSYYAHDFGLHQISIGSDNKEPSVNQLRNQIETADASRCHIMFFQSNYDSRQAENVAKQLDLLPIDINPMDADWENQIKIITDAISR